MENIIEPNKTFDFTKLTLAHPSGIQGGAYFTKILYSDAPVYIQTVKCLTKQAFVKSGKKYYSDLMFDSNAESLIQWLENLDERCQNLLLEKNDAWFQNSLTLNDIESAFNSTMRVYKSGKFYLVRTNIKSDLAGNPNIKIYNENEITLGMNDIKPETNIMAILEIQGIKFTSRSFQIEIELKQVMVLDNEPIFNNCLIKTKRPKNTSCLAESLSNHSLEKNDEFTNDAEKVENGVLVVTNEKKLEDDYDVIDTIVSDDFHKNNNISIDLDIEDLTNNDIIVEDVKELREITDVVLDNSLEAFPLKKPNEVYFDLYKEARNKAKLAKKNAIIAYLEAKNIKKTYMLENINDSDSDFDAEIDEVSESELEGL